MSLVSFSNEFQVANCASVIVPQKTHGLGKVQMDLQTPSGQHSSGKTKAICLWTLLRVLRDFYASNVAFLHDKHERSTLVWAGRVLASG